MSVQLDIVEDGLEKGRKVVCRILVLSLAMGMKSYPYAGKAERWLLLSNTSPQTELLIIEDVQAEFTQSLVCRC